MLHITAEVKGGSGCKKIYVYLGEEGDVITVVIGASCFVRKKVGRKKPWIHVPEFNNGAWRDDPFAGHKMALAKNVGDKVVDDNTPEHENVSEE
jgi:hypothetical protein